MNKYGVKLERHEDISDDDLDKVIKEIKTPWGVNDDWFSQFKRIPRFEIKNAGQYS